MNVDALAPWSWVAPLVLGRGLDGARPAAALGALALGRAASEGIDIQSGAIAVSRTLVPWVRVQHVDTRRGVLRAGLRALDRGRPHRRRQPHDPAAPAGRGRGAARADRRPRARRRGRRRAARPAPSSRCSTMAEPRRLHPVGGRRSTPPSALRNFAFPLVVIVGVTLLGGAFDGRGLLRARPTAASAWRSRSSTGVIRYQTTQLLRSTREAIHHHTGLLSQEGHRRAAGPDPGHRRPPGPAAARVRRLRGRRPDRRGREGRGDLAAGADARRPSRSCARRGRARGRASRTRPTCRRGASPRASWRSPR